MSSWLKAWCGFACAIAATISTAIAALPAPLTDDTVLARVPKRSQRSAPDASLEAAIRVAQTWIDTARRDNNPRAYGYAQQALKPWWHQPDAPTAVLRLRAKINQVDHHFDAARDDLLRIISRAPDDAQARLDAATLFTTTGRYADARAQCAHLKKIVLGLIATLCVAQIDGIEGDSRGAISRLQQSLAQAQNAPASVRAWSMTLLAELHERVGNNKAADTAFIKAIALDPADSYARIAYADFLLSQQQAAKVATLFSEPIEKLPDAALLRLAIAAARMHAADAAALANATRVRLAASAQRGTSPHAREEALLALHLDGAPERAAQLALKNWVSQKEPSDALLLLEAGRAAQNAEAIALATQWLQQTRFEHPSLKGLS